MAQVSVETGQVAVMVTACPYVAGFGEIVKLKGRSTAPKVTLGITPLGG